MKKLMFTLALVALSGSSLFGIIPAPERLAQPSEGGEVISPYTWRDTSESCTLCPGGVKGDVWSRQYYGIPGYTERQCRCPDGTVLYLEAYGNSVMG